MVTATFSRVAVLGCERHLRIEVDALDGPAAAGWDDHLDGTGVARLAEQVGPPPYAARAARARVAWASAADREWCAAHERTMPGNAGSRWDDVLDYAARMRDGLRPPCGPVFLHPGPIGEPAVLLRPVDGARRMMAAAELGLPWIAAVIVTPAGR